MDANNFWLPIIVAVIAAIPGAWALIQQGRKEKRERPLTEASEGIAASKAAAEAVRQYSEELSSVREEMSELRQEIEMLRLEKKQQDALIDEWRAGIERLVAQVVSLGHKPVWQPRAAKAE